MNGSDPRSVRFMQSFGCFGLLLIFFLLCLLPVFLVDTMTLALRKLHLTPEVALLAVVGILLGSLVNVPIHRIARTEDQLIDLMPYFGVAGWYPRFRRIRRDTIIAVNVGGCLVPLALTAWQVLVILREGGWVPLALLTAIAANVAVCYFLARPVSGVGIMMPGFASPAVAVGASWILLSAPEFDAVRAPVAFVAGVLGPVIGADLLHLKDITKVSVGMLSIGGAGTFDGIVLSGILAALLT